MLIKFCADSNIAKSVTTQLRQRGVDIIRCEDVGMAEVHDLVLLDYAASEGRTLVTNDQGFGGWHRQWLQEGKTHAGIFVVTHDKENIGMIVGQLLFWHEAIKAEAANLETDVYSQIHYIP